jgi:hypothetical protein
MTPPAAATKQLDMLTRIAGDDADIE